jgi:hypothetical protein
MRSFLMFCSFIMVFSLGMFSCSETVPEGKSYPVRFEKETSESDDSITRYSIPDSRSIKATKTTRTYQLFP